MANLTLDQRLRSFGGGAARPSYLFDRFIVGLILAATTAAAAIVVLAAARLVRPSTLLSHAAVLERWLRFEQLGDESALLARLGVAIGAALVGLITLRLLYRRIMPSAPRQQGDSSHVLSADDRGVVVVEERGICTVAAEAALRIDGVLEIEAETRGTGAGPIMLQLTAWMHAAAEMRASSDAILDRAVTAVETLTGLTVQDARVTIKVVPLGELHRRVVE